MKCNIASYKAIPSYPCLPIAQGKSNLLRGRHHLVDNFMQRSNECLARKTRSGVDIGDNFTILLLFVERQQITSREKYQVSKLFEPGSLLTSHS